MAALSPGTIDDEELRKGALQSFAQFAFISSAGGEKKRMINNAPNGGTCRGFHLMDLGVAALEQPQLTSM